MVIKEPQEVDIKSLIERKIKEAFNAYLRPDSVGLYNPKTIPILDCFAIRLNAKRSKMGIKATKVSPDQYRLRFESGDISFVNKEAKWQCEEWLQPIKVDAMDGMLMELL